MDNKILDTYPILITPIYFRCFIDILLEKGYNEDQLLEAIKELELSCPQLFEKWNERCKLNNI